MNSKIVKVLKKIEENGFEAYVVGGYVRDYLLGVESTDIDICTNALPKNILEIFELKKENATYGSISFKEGIYNFDITTYRAESDYVNRKPQVIEYVSNLLTDINRRDFTINSLCMNSNNQVIDLLNGELDIKNKLIRVVGDTNKKLTEDPLRILRAIRFSVILGFDLNDDIIKFIHNNKDLIKTLSNTRKKEELEKIFVSKNAEQGIKLLKELDLLDALEIKYDKIVVVPDILGIWAQIVFNPLYPFTKSALKTIKDVRSITISGEISNDDLFNYDLYSCLVAGEILGINKEDINHRYSSLVIKDKNEVAINSLDIINTLKIDPSDKVRIIFNDVVSNILNNKLINGKEEIKKYMIKNWK